MKTGHFNVWPITAGPEGAVAWYQLGPEALLDAVRGDDGARVVQCNHPRFEAFSYFKTIGFDAMKTDKKLLRCDLMELINGNSHAETPEVLQDWLGLLSRGIRITATGVSDCHGTSDYIGNARTWVYLGDAGAEALCTGGAAPIDAALVAGRAVASAGPMLTVKVSRGAASAGIGELLPAGAGDATVQVSLAAAQWLPLGTVQVYAGTSKVLTKALNAVPAKDGARHLAFDLPLQASPTDTFVVAVHVPAAGADAWPGVHLPAWALTNPVLIDGDGDGKWFGQLVP